VIQGPTQQSRVLWESRREVGVGEDLVRWEEEMRGEKREEERREDRGEDRGKGRGEGRSMGKNPFLGCFGRAGES
jgi:hypothetical protein